MMRTSRRAAVETALVLWGAAAFVGSVIGWCIGELIARHDPRRRYP